jgi:hypothetical protein
VSKADERRQNRALREVLDDLVAHVRHVARDARTMSKADLQYAEERLEWLAEEVWRLALTGEDPR